LAQKREREMDPSGDVNTSFFHSLANGRRKRKPILSLEDGQRTISDSDELKVHITQFYKNLFGCEPDPVVHLNGDFWSDGDRVCADDNVVLTQPFSDEEIEFAIKDMRTNTTPALMGSLWLFIKIFCLKLNLS
jgi:mannosylglycoprotein endo-beta-mannosidase